MSEAEENTSTKPKVKPVWRSVVRGLAILLAVPVVFAIVAGVLLIDRDVRAPQWLQTRLESSATQMLNGGSLEFGEIRLNVGRDLHLRARLSNAVLRDADDVTLARLPSVDALISPRGLLFRREVLVQEVIVSGAQVGFLRAADGSVALSFETNGAAVGQADNFVELLDDIDAVLAGPALDALELVRAEGLIVNYSDARANQSWTVDGGVVTLDLSSGVTSLRGAFSLLSGRPFVTDVSLFFDSPDNRRAASMGFTVRNGIARDLAVQTPALGWLSVLDAPVNASLRASIDDEGGLGPVYASLELTDGLIQPTPEARPIPLRYARAYLSYLPLQGRVSFDRAELDTDWGTMSASGQAFLRNWNDGGWPESFEGQFSLRDIALNPDGMFDEPQTIDAASAVMRMTLSPFAIDIGSVDLRLSDQDIHASGRITADSKGWGVAVDASAAALHIPDFMPLWPEEVKPDTRRWFAENLTDGWIRDATVGLRIVANHPPVIATTASFDGARFRPTPKLPYIDDAAGFVSIADNRLAIMLDQGTTTPPQGGSIDLSGTVMQIDDVRIKGNDGHFTIRTDSTLTAALSFLDQPPFEFLTKAGQPVTLADARAVGVTELVVPLINPMPPNSLQFQSDYTLRNLRSDTLVPGQRLTAAQASVDVNNSGITVLGNAQVGQVPLTVEWSQALGRDAPKVSTVVGQVEVSPTFLSQFNINLPANTVRGSTMADLRIDLERDTSPAFSLSSDMIGAEVSLPSVGWVKPAGQSGEFSVSGRLSNPPQIDALRIRGVGFSADGAMTLNTDGTMERADFGEVTIGTWFEGAVELIGRGEGRAPDTQVTNGRFDLRGAKTAGGANAGALMAQLDRLTISDGIYLSSFRGEFSDEGGFHGSFTGVLNDIAPVRGRLETTASGPAVRILSDNGGVVAQAMGLLDNAHGDALEMILTPTGTEGTYDGVLTIKNLQVRQAPTLAALLDAISVVGLLQQMNGQGLTFADVDATFRLTPDQIIVTESSAVGPGLGISLDGAYDIAQSEMNFQGVISPVYLLNGIGAVLTRPGEGLFGFNYTLRGTKGAQRISVNPLSALTPGMFRNIFRRPPPQLSQ
ncbi:DUF3971 domain-containing protein [Marivivens sp. JLT3646]|uniref:YhdP family protein n=1 Tax=Marivivens sp. JLT3646 TaxID=1920883 RepID=UPI000801A25F|nr:DUF3971 domain-containing protein [Marivivens sp. JLT3646]APO86460.1 hypothetical protein BSK21_05010 [Marivivens sp. JLT3646]OBR37752.1 hypothetical protein A9199_03855 [Donghicola sp. JL3646]